MPVYSLRTKLGQYPEKPDELVGSFPNPVIALDALNEGIARSGKDSGNQQMTIKSFGFGRSGLELLCSLSYSLIEVDGAKTAEYQLFPSSSLDFKSVQDNERARFLPWDRGRR
jgi:hypothetical protein